MYFPLKFWILNREQLVRRGIVKEDLKIVK